MDEAILSAFDDVDPSSAKAALEELNGQVTDSKAKYSEMSGSINDEVWKTDTASSAREKMDLMSTRCGELSDVISNYIGKCELIASFKDKVAQYREARAKRDSIKSIEVVNPITGLMTSEISDPLAYMALSYEMHSLSGEINNLYNSIIG